MNLKSRASMVPAMVRLSTCVSERREANCPAVLAIEIACDLMAVMAIRAKNVANFFISC